ncbi:MAG: MarR family transcriptional regulator [Bacteriovoracaceae bacterium]|nr:MarR family transcriptional regulator [Bacteriovoracaceae bacterium]
MQNEEIAKKFFDVIPPSMHLFRSYIEESIAEELSLPQFRVLANLNRGLKHISEIAQMHCVSQPAVSKLVDSLVVMELVSRHPVPEDRRSIELKLTAKGRSTFQKSKKRASKMFSSKLAGLNKKELDELNRSLSCLESFIQKVKEQ